MHDLMIDVTRPFVRFVIARNWSFLAANQHVPVQEKLQLRCNILFCSCLWRHAHYYAVCNICGL